MAVQNCQGITSYYLPTSPPTTGTFSFSCSGQNSFCPRFVWQGGTGKCCSFENALVCLDGSCRSDASCPAVVSSKAPAAPATSSKAVVIESAVPTPVPSASSSAAPARVSSAANTPRPVSSAAAAAPSASGITICSNNVNCANGWSCSIDTSPVCCPQQNQNYCLGAITCFSASKGEQCCGNTICYSGQSCAPGGNACIGPSSSQPSQASSTLTFSTMTSGKSSFAGLVPTATVTNASSSDPLGILQTGVPKTAQDNPQGACFLNTAYTSYTTPAWYTALPSPAQSYFASANAQNTAACLANSSPSNGLSDGAKAGIAIGAVAAVAALGALAYAFVKLGIIGGGAAAASGGAAASSGPGPGPGPAWNGVTGGAQGWNGVTGSGASPHHPQMGHLPPIITAGAIKRNSDSSERNRGSYVAYRPPAGHDAHRNFSSPNPYGGDYQQPAGGPRSVSPLDSNHSELYAAGAQRPNEMSGTGSPSPVRELSTSGAYPGHEIYSNEMYEAPTNIQSPQPQQIQTYRGPTSPTSSHYGPSPVDNTTEHSFGGGAPEHTNSTQYDFPAAQPGEYHIYGAPEYGGLGPGHYGA